MNPSVWYVLQRNYGGGPVIAREAVDIYSRDMAQHLKVYQQLTLSPSKLQNISNFAFLLQQPVQKGKNKKTPNDFVLINFHNEERKSPKKY